MRLSSRINLSVSIASLLVFSGAVREAYAQTCTPANPSNGDMVTCTGQSTGPLELTADNLVVVFNGEGPLLFLPFPDDRLILSGNNIDLTVNGLVDGNISFTGNDSDDVFTLNGTLGSDFAFIDLGGGNNIAIFSSTGSTVGRPHAIVADDGDDQLFIESGGSHIGVINLGSGNNRIDNAGTILFDLGLITLGAGDDQIINRTTGTIAEFLMGSVDFGDGANLLDNDGVIDLGFDNRPTIRFGAGNDRVINRENGDITANIDVGNGENVFDNSGVITGDIEFGIGNDQINNLAGGQLNADIEVAGGENVFTNAGSVNFLTDLIIGNGSLDFTNLNGGEFNGTINFSGGEGTFNLINEQGATIDRRSRFTITARNITFSNFGEFADGFFDSSTSSIDGSGAQSSFVNAASGVVLGNASIQFGTDTVADNFGLIEGRLSTGNGDDVFTNAGQFTGMGRLQSGDDLFVNAAGGVINGPSIVTLATVGLGRGDDSVVLATGSTLGENGAIFLGLGSDRVTIEEGATVLGRVTGEGRFGSSSIDVDIAIVQESSFDLGLLENFEVVDLQVTGQSLVDVGSTLTTPSLQLSSGELRVDGLLQATDFSVSSGSVISGLGTILRFPFGAPLDLQVDGVIAPGFSAGIIDSQLPADRVLDISGDVTLSPLSTLRIEVANAVTNGDVGPLVSDSVAIDGIATLDGGALEIVRSTGAPALGVSDITVLTATGGINGAFSTVTAPANFILTGVETLENSIVVSLQSQLGAGVGLSAASGVYAAYFDELAIEENSAALNALQGLFTITDGNDLDLALSGLSAQPYASADLINVETGLGIADAVALGRRTNSNKRGRITAWASGLTIDAAQDGAAGLAAGADVNVQAGLFGIGYALNNDASSAGVTIGAFFGVTDFEQSFDGLTAAIDGDGFVFGGYGAFQQDALSGQITLARITGDAEASKTIAVLGESANSAADLNAFVADLDIAYALPLADAFNISPFVGATYIDSTRSDLDEFGAGDFNLSVSEQDTTFLFTDIGVSATTSSALLGRVRPFASAAFRYEILGNDSETIAGLTAVDERVLTPGLNIARARAVLEGGASVKIVDGVDFSIAYNGGFGDGLTSHQGTARLSVGF